MTNPFKTISSPSRSSWPVRQRGVAMVEFTIVLPVILLLILGVTEIGRAIVRYNALTKAVEAGARHAATYALNGSTQIVGIDSQLQTEAMNIVVYGNPAGTGSPILEGLVPANVTITAASATEIEVAATFPYVPLFGGGIPSFGTGPNPGALSFNMATAVTMRAL